MTTPKTPSPVLRALHEARGLIADHQQWTTGVLARTSIGEVCDPWDASASCWCLEGALRRADSYGAFIIARGELAATILAATITGQPMTFAINPVARYNDEAGHGAVLDLIDRTIERRT